MMVFYYISPQVWAWKKSRVNVIRETVDRMFVILPFEKAFYRQHDYDVSYVGHPLLDVIKEQEKAGISDALWFKAKHELPDKPIIALFPGSRKQEIRQMLPAMLITAKRFPDHQFVIAAAPSVPEEFYGHLMQDAFSVPLVSGQSYELLQCAEAAVVTSGTATLETALYEVPEVVCYKGNYLSYLLARQLVKVDYISLVNLVVGKKVVVELIQAEMNADNISGELQRLLQEKEYRIQMKSQFIKLKEMLGGGRRLTENGV